MAPETPKRRESEEQSIKARKKELFDEQVREVSVSGPRKPPSVYLQQTPALPLSTGVKTTLWIVGVIVVLLFLAALMTRGARPRRPRTAAVHRTLAIGYQSSETGRWLPASTDWLST